MSKTTLLINILLLLLFLVVVVVVVVAAAGVLLAVDIEACMFVLAASNVQFSLSKICTIRLLN